MSSTIQCMCFSSDGAYLAVGTDRGYRIFQVVPMISSSATDTSESSHFVEMELDPRQPDFSVCQISIYPECNDLALVPKDDQTKTLVCGFKKYKTHILKQFSEGRTIVNIALFAKYFICSVGPGITTGAIDSIKEHGMSSQLHIFTRPFISSSRCVTYPTAIYNPATFSCRDHSVLAKGHPLLVFPLIPVAYGHIGILPCTFDSESHGQPSGQQPNIINISTTLGKIGNLAIGPAVRGTTCEYGELIVAANDSGTLIQIFYSNPPEIAAHTLRRGYLPRSLHSLAVWNNENRDCHIAAISVYGTVHIWKLCVDYLDKKNKFIEFNQKSMWSSLSSMVSFSSTLSGLCDSEWPGIQLKIPPSPSPHQSHSPSPPSPAVVIGVPGKIYLGVGEVLPPQICAFQLSEVSSMLQSIPTKLQGLVSEQRSTPTINVVGLDGRWFRAKLTEGCERTSSHKWTTQGVLPSPQYRIEYGGESILIGDGSKHALNTNLT